MRIRPVETSGLPMPFQRRARGPVVSEPFSSLYAQMLGALRIATFGDSTANFFSANTTDTSAWNIAFGAGTTQVWRRQEKMMTALLYGQAFVVANGGVSGETTTQMLARSSAGASSSRKAIEDVIALSPDVVLLRGGSINDLTALSSPIDQEDVDAIVASHKQIIDAFADEGIWVLDSGIYGYSGATNTTEVRAAIVTLNAALAAYSRSHFRFIDPTDVTHDGTGAFKSGISNDGTHLNNLGGYLIAKLEAAALRNIFGTPVGPRYAGDNVIPNADLSASGSQAYGTLGTGWNVQASSATRANAKIETINGVQMQTCEFTPTADSASATIFVPFGVYGATPTIEIEAAQVYGLEADIYVGGLAGAAPPVSQIYMRMELFTGTPRNIYGPMEFAFTTAYPEPLVGKVNFEPITIPDFGGDPANLTSNCRWILTLVMTTALDRTPFKLGIGNPRMVLLS